MSQAISGSRIRWVVSAAVGGCVVLVFLLLIRLPAPTVLPAPAPVVATQPTIKIARPDLTDALLQEEAELRDVRPLFLPTRRNVALPEPRLEPGRSFLAYDAVKSALQDSELQISKDLRIANLNGKRVEEALPRDAFGADAPESPLLGFGRGESKVAEFAPRAGFIEVTALADGRRIWAENLPAGARPAGDKLWQPMELIAVVDRIGLAAPLLVTEGTQVEEFDAHFKNFLSRTYRLGERLKPGFYRIVVAP